MNYLVYEKAKALLLKYPLCDMCLGRMFARLGGNIGNLERGRSIKRVLLMEAHEMLRKRDEKGLTLLGSLYRSGFLEVLSLIKRYKVNYEPENCYICQGIFNQLSEDVEKVLKKINEYQFNTFLVSSKLPPQIIEREDKIKSEFSLVDSESIKLNINREIGKIIAERTGKKAEFSSPEIIITYDTSSRSFKIDSKPVYIYGRYLKLVPNIYQTKFFCENCRGRGCEKCNYTGYLDHPSIEGYIVPILVEVHDGSEGVFHASGREDFDVRTLGNGRPFVVEVRQPKKRRINLDIIPEIVKERSGGKVEVRNLKYVDRKIVKKINVYSGVHEKRYRVIVKFSKEVDEDLLSKIITSLKGVSVKQRTPTRVLWKRVDKVRIKRIYDIKAKLINNKEVEFEILCQGGLYIKELVTGDNGRTTPSIAELANCDVEVKMLDIIEIAPNLEEILFG